MTINELLDIPALHPNLPAEKTAAARIVRRHATGPDDERDLLAALGIDTGEVGQ